MGCVEFLKCNRRIEFEEEVEEEKPRERWSSRVAFIFAAMGAAIGFGNVWRFPSLAYEYGGGAFFVPYLMALFLIGIPILVLEIGLGQYYQSGDTGAFGAISRRLIGIGVASVTAGFFVNTYYIPLIAWTTNAFFDTFGENFAWEGLTGSEAYDYFLNEIIGMSTLGSDLTPTRLVPKNVGYLAMNWAIICLCISFGIHNEGKITYFTMGFPIICLFIFLGLACSLDGASDGVNAYIGEWDMSVLREKPDVWTTAVTQIFFSISLTFGIMTAFGSHCQRDAPAFANSTIIACSNSLFSFIAGFMVFAGVGYLAKEEGVAIDDLKISGPGLVFGSFPAVLANLDGGKHWVRLFFFWLFLLGLDSAFALQEAVVTVCRDTVRLGKLKRPWIALGSCLVGFTCGLLYVTDAGLIFLDTVDFYINFIMILVGFFECFAAGWVFGFDKQVESFGWKPVMLLIATTFGSVCVACGLWFGLEVDQGAAWAGFVGLASVYALGFIGILYHAKQHVLESPDSFPSRKAFLKGLYFDNVVDFRGRLSSVIGFLPLVWALMIKHFLPPVLLILFANLAVAENDEGESKFGHYESYVMWPFQIVGILALSFIIIILLSGMIVPSLYRCFVRAEVEQYIKETTENSGKSEKKDLTPPDDTQAMHDDTEPNEPKMEFTSMDHEISDDGPLEEEEVSA